MSNSRSVLGVIKRKMFNRPKFATSDVKIGRNVVFGKNVVFNCKRVRIGDGCVFMNNIKVDSEVFEIGDYGKIYDYCFFPGPGHLKIGHNLFLGTGCVIDSKGDTSIGNNVGIGAYSQLWTHIIYGDVMCGCRFNISRNLIMGNDIYVGGNCLINPVKIGDRSMIALGSVITKDTLPDRSYAGVPAIDVTEKIGSQFKMTSVDERMYYLMSKLEEIAKSLNLKNAKAFAAVTTDSNAMKGFDRNITVFNVADRTYIKRGTRIEHKVMWCLLPDAKFIPIDCI